jgi:Spy/CpxP family protein refolding chaperone
MKYLAITTVMLLALASAVPCQPAGDAPKAGFERIVEIGQGHGPMCGSGGASAAMGCGPMGPGGMDCCDMGPGMKGRHGCGPEMGMNLLMAEELELTADQKVKIEKMRTEFQLAAIDQQAKIKKTRILLGDLRRDDKAAASAVEAKIDEMARLRAEMAKMKYRHHEAVKGVLTDKQKETLKKMMEEGPVLKRIKEIRIHDDKGPDEMEG